MKPPHLSTYKQMGVDLYPMWWNRKAEKNSYADSQLIIHLSLTAVGVVLRTYRLSCRIRCIHNLILCHDGGILVFVLKSDPQRIIQATFGVNKNNTDETVCRRLYLQRPCSVLYHTSFLWKYVLSLLYTYIHNYRPCTVTDSKYKHLCEQVDHYHYAYPF